MLRFLRITFRYRIGAMYMLIGYMVSFVILFNGYSFYLASRDARKGDLEAGYRSSTAVCLDENIAIETYLEAATDLSCNVTIYDVPMFSDSEYVTRLVRVGLWQPEGEAADGCVLGDSLAQYTQIVDGETCFVLDGVSYKVGRVIDGRGGMASEVIYIPYSLLNKTDPEVLYTKFKLAEIVFESNRLDTAQEAQAFEESLSTRIGRAVHLSSVVLDLESPKAAQSRLGMYLCGLAYLFCIVNCIVICEFWLYERRYELAVRRAFHLSDRRIVGMLFTDMMRIVLTALVCYAVLQGCLLGPVMHRLGVSSVYDMRTVLFLAGMIPCSAAVTILPYICKLKKMSYVNGLKEVMS